MVILFPQIQKELVAVSQEKYSLVERSRLLLKPTVVVNKDDVIIKCLGLPGIPRAENRWSQSLASQWIVACLMVFGESAQSPGRSGFLQKDQRPLLYHACKAGGQHRALWTDDFGLWWRKWLEFHVWRVLQEVSVSNTVKRNWAYIRIGSSSSGCERRNSSLGFS